VFDSLGIDRSTVLGNIETIVKKVSGTRKSLQSTQIGLFGAATPTFTLQLEPKEPIPVTDLVVWEKELIGFYVSNHPLTDYLSPARMKAERYTSIKDALAETNEKLRLKIAGSVTQVKKIMTKKGDAMVFAKLEDVSDNIEIVVFPDVFSSTADLWEEGKLVKLIGNISKKDGEIKIICQEAKLIVATEVA
jgi:DNA polymerase-3 subunit alpha